MLALISWARQRQMASLLSLSCFELAATDLQQFGSIKTEDYV
jgi:hypothetical protein